MTRYKVKTQFVFEGEFVIEANNAFEAHDIVKHDCGLVMGGNVHTTRDDEVIDWNFPCHADKKIMDINFCD